MTSVRTRDTGVLDPATLATLEDIAGGDVAFLAGLFDTFFEESPRLLTAMRQAAEDADAELLRRSAHSLKSNSLVFGARTLGSICQELEDRGKHGLACDVISTILLAEAAYADVELALRAVRPKD